MPSNALNTIIVYILLIAGGCAMAQNSEEALKTDTVVKRLLTNARNNVYSNPDKSILYLNKALGYENEVSEKQLLNLYQVAGLVNYNQQAYFIALDYYYKSLALQEKLDPSKSHFMYNNIACIYMELGDTDKSQQYLNKSLEGLKRSIAKGESHEKNVEASLIYGNLAVIEIDKKNYKKALEMLYIHKKHSARLKDTTGIIIAYQNLSNIYNSLKQRDSSNYYSKKGIFLAQKNNQPNNLAGLYYYKGLNYSETKNDSAMYYLQQAYVLAEKIPLNDVKLLASRALANLYEAKDDFKKSNYYLRIATSLSEKNISEQNKKKTQLLEFENKQKIKQQQIFLDTQKRENFFLFGFILLVPISIIGFLMYRLQRSKSLQRKVENELLMQKMEGKNKELTSNAIQILQANEIIDYTQKGLNQLKTVIDTPNNKVLTQIISDLKKGNQSFNKKEFEKLFIETDEEFYKKLLQRYPLLTKNEIRLCAFAKMNFSTKDISAITQQSSNSILVARSRLRKKIGLADNQSLTGFFKSF